MNAITNFRLCTLTDVELLQEIDKQTDKMFTEQKVPVRHIPAEPNKDYDLLIGELLIRYTERLKSENQICYKSKEPCAYDCKGLCKESC